MLEELPNINEQNNQSLNIMAIFAKAQNPNELNYMYYHVWELKMCQIGDDPIPIVKILLMDIRTTSQIKFQLTFEDYLSKLHGPSIGDIVYINIPMLSEAGRQDINNVNVRVIYKIQPNMKYIKQTTFLYESETANAQY